MHRPIRFLSLFSGIEAASVAWCKPPLNWECIGFSEIEPFARAVLQYHYPEVPNYGDVTKYKEWPELHPDIIVGGSPCQTFSLAGLRKGLDDPRGNLALVYLGVVDRFRPRFIVWENVPGVLSVDEGRAFGTFLGGLAELGYGFAYRIQDAQYHGVAQRRRRVFVVGYLGDWRPAAAVLFEPESLLWNTAPKRRKREDGTEHTENGLGFDSEKSVATARMTAIGEYVDDDCASTIKSLDYKDATDLVCYAVRTANTNANGCGIAEEVAHTIDRAQGQAVAFRTNAAGQIMSQGNLAATLNTFTDPCAQIIQQSMVVRRLTPVEHERLQGFPDGWTAIPWKGKTAETCPDSLRYKATGNSMAVPVMAWIGRRIQLVMDGVA